MTGERPNSVSAEAGAGEACEPTGSRSLAQRRRDLEQALANTRISGHDTTAEYLADCEAFIEGRLGAEEMLQRITERARDADRKASSFTGGPPTTGVRLRPRNGFSLEAGRTWRCRTSQAVLRLARCWQSASLPLRTSRSCHASWRPTQSCWSRRPGQTASATT